MVPQPFDALSPSQWRVLRARGWETALAPGEVLSRKGASRGSVLVVRKGLLRASAVSAEGKRFTFRLLHPGETSGEASLVADLPSLADISAVRPSAVLQLPRSACLSLLKDNPAFAEAMLRAVSGRLHDIATGMERLALLDVRGRLADVLRHLARAEGKVTPQGIAIPFDMPQTELSAMVAATREAVNRQIRQWEVEGVLTRSGGALVLRRPDALRQAAMASA